MHSGNCEHSITVTESRAELTVEFPEDTSNEECETIISESLQKTINSKNLTVECKLKNSRRKRSTIAKFLVSIIFIDEKPTEKDEINDTVFNDDIVLISEKDYFNNIEFDLGEILKEALTITQRDSNMTLNFNVEEIKIFEDETKQVIINTEERYLLIKLFFRIPVKYRRTVFIKDFSEHSKNLHQYNFLPK